MEKHIKDFTVGSIGIILCIVMLIFIGYLTNNRINNIVKKQHAANLVNLELKMKALLEAGYARGQADALRGTVRIHIINDSTYVWVTSPWGTVKPVNDTIHINIINK